VRRKDDADRLAVVAVNLDLDVVDQQAAVVAEDVGAERVRLERLLVHEVKAVGVGK